MSQILLNNRANKRHNLNKNIHYSNESLFNKKKKMKSFIIAFHNNKKSVAVVTDFDFTITAP